ncbi:hypothetical protein GIB67_030791 [Kingdonia uniflora]|uniref:TRF2/HOY1 PH-like domain-containing protein n=1 Tax=Kingdonia uniflora TaxID=39325 RepID=A0A7J7L371_9MAGN|nr:hypothetical protein GIB67_030791 [Kingdonia uniflora]
MCFTFSKSQDMTRSWYLRSWVFHVQRVSRYDGELVAKFYFAKRKFVWEVLDFGINYKIEVPWSDIASLKSNCHDIGLQLLEIELLRPPMFFQETNPQPKRHTLWKGTTDFTGGQASIFRQHSLKFPEGTLQKHFDKLLQLDNRLSSLSKKPYPSLDSPLYCADYVEGQNPIEDKSFVLQESSVQNKLFELGTSAETLEQINRFTNFRNIPQNYARVVYTASHNEISSPPSETSGVFLGHGTSDSTTHNFRNLFMSLPSSSPNCDTLNTKTAFYDMISTIAEVETDLLGNALGVGDLLAATFEGIGEIEKYFSEFSYSENLSNNIHEEIDGDCDYLVTNISKTNTFPVFTVEDET